MSNDIIDYLKLDKNDTEFINSYKNLIANIKRYHCWRYIIDEYI